MKQITVKGLMLQFDAIESPVTDVKQSVVIIEIINLELQKLGLNVQPQLIWEDPNTEKIEVSVI